MDSHSDALISPPLSILKQGVVGALIDMKLYYTRLV